MRHDAAKPMTEVSTPIITKPTQNSEYRKDETQDAMRHDADKPTNSVTTLIIPMPTEDSE
jgi:hypothetical protein